MTAKRKLSLVFAFTLILALTFAFVAPFTVQQAIAAPPTVEDRDSWVNPYNGTYYNNLNTNLTGSAFRTELASLITTTHKHKTSYDELKNLYKTTDADPNNNGNVIWFYTGSSVPYTGAMDSGTYRTNREHVWPKQAGSAFPEKTDAGSDAHHLRPLNTELNNTRSNKQFGEVAMTSSNRVAQTGVANYGTSDPNTWCYTSGNVFYPAKGYRGATARILFYVQTRWGNQYNLEFVLGEGFSKTIGDIETLMKWHIEEPPTDQEIRRNEAVAKIQGNRNPFIDHPEYAEMIYCNNGASYSNTLKNVVAEYGGYLNGNLPPVPDDKPTALTLSVSSLNLEVGQVSPEITVTATPSGASNSVDWTSDSRQVATVSDGVVTAKSAGTARITATSTVDSSVSASITVTVTNPVPPQPPKLESLVISPSSLSLTTGGTRQLTVTALPAGTSNAVTWNSSNGAVATVSNAGLVTAIGAGTARITATSTVDGSISASITVTVTSGTVTPDPPDPPKLESLFILPNRVTLTTGGTQQLRVTALPAGTSNAVTWESDDRAVATVSDTGLVTATGTGTAKITATSTVDGNITASITVTVQPDPPKLESLTIYPNSVSLTPGDIQQLTVTASPAGTSNAVTWNSDNGTVATVSDVGLVTATGTGTAKITATSTVDGSITASITVTVSPVPPELESLVISPSSLSLTSGDVRQLTVEALPAGTSNAVIWDSDNEAVATVSDDGLVTAIGVGTAKITATSAVDGNITASITVTVQPAPPKLESLVISPSSLFLTTGGTRQLTVTASPAGTSNAVIWDSDNEAVATVSDDGLVTAIGVGTAKITATSAVDGNITASITVTVTSGTVTPDPPSEETLAAFKAAVAAISDKSTLAERYDAIKAAIDEYNKLTEEARAAVAEQYNTLLSAVEQYNADIEPHNDQFAKATDFGAQALAIALSSVLLAIAVIVGKGLGR